MEIEKSVNLNCVSKPPVSWTHNDGALPKNIQTYQLHEGGTMNVLTIEAASIHNVGKYTCEGKTRDGHYFYFQKYLQVIGKI